MTNPLIHALVFAAAVIIPGGLLIYVAWRATRRRASFPKESANRTAKEQGSEDISESSVSPDEALEAFLQAYPKYPKDSLRARSRVDRLKLHKTKPRKKS